MLGVMGGIIFSAKQLPQSQRLGRSESPDGLDGEKVADGRERIFRFGKPVFCPDWRCSCEAGSVSKVPERDAGGHPTISFLAGRGPMNVCTRNHRQTESCAGNGLSKWRGNKKSVRNWGRRPNTVGWGIRPGRREESGNPRPRMAGQQTACAGIAFTTV